MRQAPQAIYPFAFSILQGPLTRRTTRGSMDIIQWHCGKRQPRIRGLCTNSFEAFSASEVPARLALVCVLSSENLFAAEVWACDQMPHAVGIDPRAGRP